MPQTSAPSPAPVIERHRFEIKRRDLTILRKEMITPNMLRLVFKGADLEGFSSPSPDDHVKIFVPDGTGGEVMREYTPRFHDAERQEMWMDFALHDAGPATLWAKEAKPGDRARIAGPRGSAVITGPIRSWVLIGDETALPAIARRIEELAPDTPVTSVVAVPGPQDEQTITTRADHLSLWVHRDDPTDPAPLVTALESLTLPEQTFVWIAAEGSVARALRDCLSARGHMLQWMKAAGYWVSGQADTSDKSLT
ncbi:siderophore-interacting protein [Rhodobacteraceae bacterium]|nr:siderophore-interacting protein [Paracoccaceae bacterium]